MRGGKRRGAGRKKGSRNNASAAREAAIAASGLVPLDYMPMVMRDETQPTAVRVEMAKAAAPYCHPKFAAVEHTGSGEGGRMIHEHRIRFVGSPSEDATGGLAST